MIHLTGTLRRATGMRVRMLPAGHPRLVSVVISVHP